MSKEKEIQVLFEIRNVEAKRKILLIKKVDSKSDISQYKRFNFYPVDGNLKAIDFSVKGEIEKIYLNPLSVDAKKSDIKKETSKETLIENDLDIKNNRNRRKIKRINRRSKSRKKKRKKKSSRNSPNLRKVSSPKNRLSNTSKPLNRKKSSSRKKCRRKQVSQASPRKTGK